MSLIRLTLKSILSRKLTSVLLILSIGLSTMLLLGVQKIKVSAKRSFSYSISGTDLIVGTRAGDIQLLLYTVFRQGQPVANISWESIKAIRDFPEVDWVVPVSLGDSHRGYPVLGTSKGYFQHYKYGKKKPLTIQQGRPFQTTFEAVLGSDVAKQLGYTPGTDIYLSHGVAKGRLPLHDHRPFQVVGILKPTGTPVDKTVHIPLEGMTALHVDPRQLPDKSALIPSSVTGGFIGLHSKFSIFNVQRRITDWPDEPLMAIIPGVSLSRLWNSISSIDTALFIITFMVIIIAFIGLLSALFMSLHQRRRELAILRTMGAHPLQLALLLTLESVIITVSGVTGGLLLIAISGYFIMPILEDNLGLILSVNSFTLSELYLILGIIAFGVITSFVPALLAYRKGLSGGVHTL